MSRTTKTSRRTQSDRKLVDEHSIAHPSPGVACNSRTARSPRTQVAGCKDNAANLRLGYVQSLFDYKKTSTRYGRTSYLLSPGLSCSSTSFSLRSSSATRLSSAVNRAVKSLVQRGRLPALLAALRSIRGFFDLWVEIFAMVQIGYRLDRFAPCHVPSRSMGGSFPNEVILKVRLYKRQVH